MYQPENRLIFLSASGFNRSKKHSPLYIKHVLGHLEAFKVVKCFLQNHQNIIKLLMFF